MYRTLFKFAVTTITILTVNLITTKISDYMISYKRDYSPLTFTLISMGIITIIFYPLFMKMEDWLNNLSVKVIKSGRSLGGKYLGLISIFFICFFILFCFYARMWYNIDVIRAIFQGRIANLF